MAKVKGKDIYIEVNTGTVGAPVWTKVGGQKSCTIDRGTAAIDVSDKDSNEWEESLAGYKNWSIPFDAFLIEDDAAYLEIETSYEGGIIDQYRISTPAHVYIGYALIEGLSMGAPDGDASVVSFTLKGTAALAKT